VKFFPRFITFFGEKELIALSKDSNMHSAIVGDFNTKTGTLNDFIIPDETLLDLFN
jgi:hypothetical protein